MTDIHPAPTEFSPDELMIYTSTVRTVRAIRREYLRRINAAAVMEEATAELARRYQRFAYISAKYIDQIVRDRVVHNEPWENYEESRLARRYLLALVGDGTGEEAQPVWMEVK